MPASNPVLIQNHPRSRAEPPPLFLIHDASGLLTAYFRLGPLGRRVYGIFDPRFDQDGLGGWQSVEEIAEAYVRLVRRVVIRGEIVLGGWSFGGVLAVQMAHILATRGRGLRVSRIVLVDSVYPRCLRPEARKRPQHEEEALDLPGVDDETREKLTTALMRATCISDGWEPPRWAARDGNTQGADPPIPPPTVLIRAKEEVPMKSGGRCPLDRTRFLPQLGWEDMQGDFVSQVVEMDGNHYNLFDEPQIDKMTANLKKALEAVI